MRCECDVHPQPNQYQNFLLNYELSKDFKLSKSKFDPHKKIVIGKAFFTGNKIGGNQTGQGLGAAVTLKQKNRKNQLRRISESITSPQFFTITWQL